MTETRRSPRSSHAKKRLAMVLGGRRRRRRRRARGGIRDRPPCRQCGGGAGLPPGAGNGAADRAAGPRRGGGRWPWPRPPKRLPDLAFKDARRRAARRWPTGAAAPCCSTCGPPGACPAARRCRRSTRCRPSSAGRISRWSRSTSTPAIPTKPKAWLKEVGINRLGYYADPSAKVFQDLKEVGKAFGMPTTLLIDRQRLRDRDAGRARRNGRATTRSS